MLLDGLPAALRHLGFMVVAVLLAWLASDIVPQMQGKPGIVGAIGIALTVLVSWATPLLTRQYGVGSPPTLE